MRQLADVDLHCSRSRISSPRSRRSSPPVRSRPVPWSSPARNRPRSRRHRRASADERCCGRRPSRRWRARRRWRRSSRSPCARSWPWHCRSDVRSRRQSRSPAAGACPCSFEIVARMSGFSTSCSGGMPAAVFFSFCSPSLATRQSATAAAKIAISAGSAASTRCSMSRADSTRITVTPAGSRRFDRAGDQRHVGARGLRRGGDGKALLAGGAVGDIAHRDRSPHGSARP